MRSEEEIRDLRLIDWVDANHPDGEKWCNYGAKILDTLVRFRDWVLEDSEK